MAATPPFPPGASPELRAVDSLQSAMLLSFTGGGLDVFTYLNHGKVFAGAMTGDSVLLGIAVLHARSMEIARCVLPLLAFVAGVWAARALERHVKQHAMVTGLLCESLVLFAASWLPGGFPDLIFVPIIALAAAFQVGSFRLADSYSYNSTFITGNLRTAISSLYDSGDPAERGKERARFRDLSLTVCGFLAGAVVGALASPRLLNHTLWVLDLPLIAVLAMALLRGREPGPSL